MLHEVGTGYRRLFLEDSRTQVAGCEQQRQLLTAKHLADSLRPDRNLCGSERQTQTLEKMLFAQGHEGGEGLLFGRDDDPLLEDPSENARLRECRDAGGSRVNRGSATAYPLRPAAPIGAGTMVQLEEPVNQQPLTGRLAACSAATLLGRCPGCQRSGLRIGVSTTGICLGDAVSLNVRVVA